MLHEGTPDEFLNFALEQAAKYVDEDTQHSVPDFVSVLFRQKIVSPYLTYFLARHLQDLQTISKDICKNVEKNTPLETSLFRKYKNIEGPAPTVTKWGNRTTGTHFLNKQDAIAAKQKYRENPHIHNSLQVILAGLISLQVDISEQTSIYSNKQRENQEEIDGLLRLPSFAQELAIAFYHYMDKHSEVKIDGNFMNKALTSCFELQVFDTCKTTASTIRYIHCPFSDVIAPIFGTDIDLSNPERPRLLPEKRKGALPYLIYSLLNAQTPKPETGCTFHKNS